MDIKGLDAYKKWFDGLPKKDRARAAAAVARLAERPSLELVRLKLAKHLEGDIWELRPGNLRIIYFLDKDAQEYVLLSGFKKQGQKTPRKIIDLAESRMNEYVKARKSHRRAE